jgi:hypothetical protein
MSNLIVPINDKHLVALSLLLPDLIWFQILSTNLCFIALFFRHKVMPILLLIFERHNFPRILIKFRYDNDSFFTFLASYENFPDFATITFGTNA